MTEKVNVNRGSKIVFSKCSDPRSLKNIVKEDRGIKIVRCEQHGGYYLSVLGSSGGYHYETLQGAIQGWKSTFRFHKDNP